MKTDGLKPDAFNVLAKGLGGNLREAPPLPWYDMGRLTPYRDPIMVVGFLCIVGGCSLLSVPAALIVLGLGLIKASALMAR